MTARPPTRAQIIRAAKAICRARCNGIDEPCCIDVATEYLYAWPPPGCANPSCIALASCALDAAMNREGAGNREAEADHPQRWRA
jgi:hypothetical protein